MSVRVSKHAITRYIERVAPVSREQAFNDIMSHRKALEAADAFGGCTVHSSDGARFVVEDGWVKTVLGADCKFNHPAKAA